MSITDSTSKTDEQVKAEEEAMREGGLSPTVSAQQSYFGFEQRHRCVLPDGVSYIEHKTLTEGDRRKYLDKLNREVKVQRATGDTVMRLATGSERSILLEAAVVGWNLVDDKGPVTFSNAPGGTFQKWLDGADPKIVDILEKAIRKNNPWLMAEMTTDDIRKQITELEEMLEVKLQEEEGKES